MKSTIKIKSVARLYTYNELYEIEKMVPFIIASKIMRYLVTKIMKEMRDVHTNSQDTMMK